MKKSKVLAMVTAAGLVRAIIPLSALAAVVSEETPDASVQQQVTLEKTAEVVPTYTVDVPAQVEIGKDAKNLSFSMNLENHDEFIPSGKKVSVKIVSAGYPGTLNKFAVWDSSKLQEASYEIYETDAMAGGRYSIGDEVASWTGSNWGTQNRRIKAVDYENIQPGSYSGVINYSISLEDA